MSEIVEFARSIARSDPEDPQEQGEILERLVELRSRIEGPGAEEIVSRLDSAKHLTKYLLKMGDFGGEEVLRIVSRIVASLDRYFRPMVRLRPESEGPNAPPSLGTESSHAMVPSEPRNRPSVPQPPPPPALPQRAGGHLGLVEDMLLGEILVQFGTVNSDQVCEALDYQGQAGLRFGDALVALGYATRSDIQSGIAHQEQLRRDAAGRKAGEAPAAALPSFRPVRGDLRLVSEMLLGEVLVSLGEIDADQLQRGLQMQRATGIRIGEALVSLGFVDWPTVQRGLKAQTERSESAQS